MKALRYILLLGVIIALTQCTKPSEEKNSLDIPLAEVTIPAGFDWKMAHSVTFHVTGSQNQVIKITTADGSIQMHKSMIPAGEKNRDIRLSVPDFIKEVQVNGVPVTITGPDVYVTIPMLKDMMLINYVLVFDGVDDYVDLGDVTQLNNVAAFTVEGWANQTLNTDSEVIFSKVSDANNDISLYTSGGSMFVDLGNGSDSYATWANYSATVTTASWFHWAIVYDGAAVSGLNADKLLLYINGNSTPIVLAFTGTIPTTTSSSLSSNNANLSTTAGPFGGKMDEVRIWSVARSGAEIAANYNKIISESTANLVACWRMDEGTGTTLTDETSNNYNGTINGCTWIQFINAWDSDGDGVTDLDDDYPLDDTRAFDNYTPLLGAGTLAFEDLWPSWGDYDFNDLILDYRFKTVTNASDDVVEIFGTFIVRANGAKMHNGFGFELPDAVAGVLTNVVVTGYSHTQGIITIDGTSHFESGQTNPVVIVFDDTWDLMPGIYNTVPGGAAAPHDTVVITMTVTGGGPFEDTDFSLDTWNPFLFIDLERGREVHLINYEPTDLMTTSYLGTYDDASDPGLNLYYQTSIGYPWGMDFPISYAYTCEYREPSIAYLHFIEWILGVPGYDDWYSNTGPGYRNTTYIYAP